MSNYRRSIEWSVWYQTPPFDTASFRYFLLVDAAEAAFSYTRAKPFEGKEPILFGFTWYFRLKEDQILLLPSGARVFTKGNAWQKLALRLSERGVGCEPGTRLLPDKSEIVYGAETYRLVLRLKRE